MLQLTKEGGIVQWRLDKAPRRGKAAIFLPRNDSKFEEGTGLAAMAGSAGSPSVPRKEPHGPVPFETSTSVQSLREANLPLCTGLGACYLFMHRVSPYTCARIPAARRSLPLAPAWHGLEEPSGLGTRATATRSLQSRWRGKPRAPFPPRSCLGAGPGEDTPMAPPLALTDPVSFLRSRLLKTGPTPASVVSLR